LKGLRDLVAGIVNQPFNAMENGLIVMLLISLIRRCLSALAGRLKGIAARIVGSDVTLTIVSLLLFVIVVKRNGIDPTYPWLDMGFAGVLLLVFIGVALRFGL